VEVDDVEAAFREERGDAATLHDRAAQLLREERREIVPMPLDRRTTFTPVGSGVTCGGGPRWSALKPSMSQTTVTSWPARASPWQRRCRPMPSPPKL
jgi:hypothetical protein